MAIEECNSYVAEWRSNKGDLLELVALVKNRLTCIFHEISDEGLVYSVFEVLNSRGLDVSWFDRTKSLLMAIVFEKGGGNKDELIDEVHHLWSEIYRCIGLRIGLSAESLQFAGTLRMEKSPNRPLGLPDAAELLRQQSETGPQAVINTVRWLKAVTEAVDHLRADRRRNAVTGIVQARLLATATNLRSDLSTEEKARILEVWERVSFRIFGLLDKDARTSVGDYVRLAWSLTHKALSAVDIMDGLYKIGNSYSISDAINSVKGTDRYNGWQEELRYMLYRYEEHLAEKAGQKFNNEQWNRIWEANASDSIDHIMPQSVGPEETVHRLGNLCLLPPGLNSELGAKLPHDKVDDYYKTGLFLAQEVAPAMAHWSEQAILEREERILRWAKVEWAD